MGTCVVLEGGGVLELDTFNVGIVHRADDTKDGCVKSICDPLKGGGEVWLEVFEGLRVSGAIGSCVLLEGVAELVFERFNGGMTD